MNADVVRPRDFFLQVHITSRCNLACGHCYVEEIGHDMPLDLLKRVLDQFQELVHDLSVPSAWVQLTGGEPLLHPQVQNILSMSSASFATRVLTNGTLIDKQTAEMLRQHCESVQISFDGTRDVHNLWRGEGSYDEALVGLMRLRHAGIPAIARMTVAADNQAAVFPLLDELSTHIDGFAVSRVVPTGGCSIAQPDTDVYRRIVYKLYGRHFSDSRVRLRDPFFGPLMKADGIYGFCGCSAGICGMCVTETGDVYPCRRLPIRLGNVQSDSLADLYRDHPLMRSLRERTLSGRCGECADRMVCGGSRCIAFAVTGDPLGPDQGCIFV